MDKPLTQKEIDLLKKIILYKDTEIRQSIDTLTKEQIKADFLKIQKELVNSIKNFSIEYTNLADKLESLCQKLEKNIAVQGVRLADDFFSAIQDFSNVISDITTLIFVILGECDLESEISKMEVANAELLIKANVVTERLESYKKWADDDFVANEDVIIMQIQSLNMFINDIKGELDIISSANMQWRDTGLEKRYNNVISESNKAIAIIKNAIIEFVDTIKSKFNFNTGEHLNKLNDLITKAKGLEIFRLRKIWKEVVNIIKNFAIELNDVVLKIEARDDDIKEIGNAVKRVAILADSMETATENYKIEAAKIAGIELELKDFVTENELNADKDIIKESFIMIGTNKQKIARLQEDKSMPPKLKEFLTELGGEMEAEDA